MKRIEIEKLAEIINDKVEQLNKNPSSIITDEVIENMLRKATVEIMKDHFFYIIRRDIKDLIKKKYKTAKDNFILKMVSDILNDTSFRRSLETHVKKLILNNIR